VSIDSSPLSLDFFGIEVEIATMDLECLRLLSGNYGFFQAPPKNPVLRYEVARCPEGRFEILRSDGVLLLASDDGDFLFQMEKEITIEIQKHRSDLYFLHAAALERDGLGFILVAESGGGKSTTTWALCHHGFRYLSDELAPIDLNRLEISPYSHALSLKRQPPSPYELPQQTVRTSRTLHVPVTALPGGANASTARLAAMFFVSYRPDQELPRATPISRAEAATRLFANALNPLAHPEEGLDGVLQIATRCSSFELITNDLAQTCTVVKQTMDSLKKKVEGEI
jgi:hypothetical protein